MVLRFKKEPADKDIEVKLQPNIKAEAREGESRSVDPSS